MSVKVRNSKAIEVVNRDDYIEQFYVDGVQNVVFSGANCKIEFFQTVSGPGDAEHRRVVQTMVLPTAALAEMCSNILSSFEANREQMESAFFKQQEKFISSLRKKSHD